MIDSGAWLLASAALAFGAASSLHCAAMCGPLAACFAPKGLAAAGYHAARLTTYTLLGAAAGAMGDVLPSVVGETLGRVVPLLFAVLFVGSLAGVWPRLAIATPLSRLLRAGSARLGTLGPATRGLAMGAMTPLLPCATFAGVLALAFTSGRASTGALALAAFGLASLPLLAAAQLGLGALGELLSFRAMSKLRMGLMATSALLVAARAAATTLGSGCH